MFARRFSPYGRKKELFDEMEQHILSRLRGVELFSDVGKLYYNAWKKNVKPYAYIRDEDAPEVPNNPQSEEDTCVDPIAFWKRKTASDDPRMDAPRVLSDLISEEESYALVNPRRINFLCKQKIKLLPYVDRIQFYSELLNHVRILKGLERICKSANESVNLQRKKEDSSIRACKGFNERSFNDQLDQCRARLDDAFDEISNWYNVEKQVSENLSGRLAGFFTEEYLRKKGKLPTNNKRLRVMNDLDTFINLDRLDHDDKDDDHSVEQFFSAEHANYLCDMYDLSDVDALLYFYKLSTLAFDYHEIKHEIDNNLFCRRSVLKDTIAEAFNEMLTNSPENLLLSQYERSIDDIIHSPRFSFIATSMLNVRLGFTNYSVSNTTLMRVSEQHYGVKLRALRNHAGESGTCFYSICARDNNINAVACVDNLRVGLLDNFQQLNTLFNAYRFSPKSKSLLSFVAKNKPNPDANLSNDELHRQLTLATLIFARRYLQDDRANGFVKHQLDDIYAQLGLPVCDKRSLKELASDSDSYHMAKRLLSKAYESTGIALEGNWMEVDQLKFWSEQYPISLTESFNSFDACIRDMSHLHFQQQVTAS